MSHRPVPPGYLRTLAEQARRVGALLVLVTGGSMRHQLTATLVEAAQLQEVIPGYPAALQLWRRHYAGACDECPPAASDRLRPV